MVFLPIFECQISNSSSSKFQSEHSRIFVIISLYGKIMFLFLLSIVRWITIKKSEHLSEADSFHAKHEQSFERLVSKLKRYILQTYLEPGWSFELATLQTKLRFYTGWPQTNPRFLLSYSRTY